jgi:hypothetical protein
VSESGDDPLGRHLSRLDEPAQAVLRRRRRNVLRIGTAVLSGVMALAALDGVGAVDAVGPDTTTVRARGGEVSLTVRHATVTRPALATPLEITVTRAGGFGGQDVEVAITTDYLLLFDLNGILPAPAEETADGDRQVWTFSPPEGDTLRIVYEARIEPAAQGGRSGRVAVLGAGGQDEVAVSFTTSVRP